MIDQAKIRQAVELMLEGIGEDKSREGLAGTPDRIARMYEEIFSGMEADPADILNTTFASSESELVIEKDITFYSMCEHHFMPFYGKAHIGYVPNGRVAGLSKLARTVELYAKRPQIQERMTSQIADALMEHLGARGAVVLLEAEHMCMTMRGVKKPGSKTVTVATRGILTKESPEYHTFLQMIKG